MYFALTEDQREFGAAVRGYLADRFDLDAVRAVVEERDSVPGAREGHPGTLWKAAAEQGWTAVLVTTPSSTPERSMCWRAAPARRRAPA